MTDFNVGIVGLGLIGASMAKSLYGYKGWRIIGFDNDSAVIEGAKYDGVIAEGYTKMDATKKCDVVIFATPPSVTLSLINGCEYKNGALICDACGVKGFMNKIREDIDFVGMHPMAGKEVSGYINGDSELFVGKNLLLMKRDNTTERACLLAEELGRAMGFRVLRWTDSRVHDEMIGFTSQMPHLLSAIIVRNPLYEESHDFEGGSMEDFTRIARLDAPMWAALFYKNQDNLRKQCDYYIEELEKFRSMLDDKDAMTEYMQAARENRINHEQSKEILWKRKKS